MRVIITGGSGLIGRALAKSLTADVHEVIILSRSPERVVGLPAGVKVAGWDGRTAQGWGSLADGADAIVNLAGEPLDGGSFFPKRWNPERKQRATESRVQAGAAVTQAVEAARKKPEVVIQASAVGYHMVGEEKITEDSPNGSDFQAQVCAVWERSSEAVERMGVRRVIIRTGLPLTPEGGVLPRLLLPFKLFAGGPMGGGKQWMPWIHITDEVRAIRYLIVHKQASGPYILSVPQPIRNRDFAKIIGQVLKRPAFMPAPALAIKLAFGEVATLALDGWQAYPERLMALGFEFVFTNLKVALRDLLGK